MAKILVADDERSICEAFGVFLRAEGHTPLLAATGREAIELVRRERPELAFLDVRMPGLDGLATLRELGALDPSLPVVIMTAYGTLDTATEALRANAFDYLGKPVELAALRAVIGRALHRAAPAEAAAAVDGVPQPAARPVLVGQSRAMQELFKLIVLLADTDLTALVLGESGVGKELVARALHAGGQRAAAPFVAVNCAAMPEHLIEAELFGHERGAFTDAREARVGRCEAAGSGTLFLDEVSELPLPMQGKLLRVLQERSFERVGSSTPRPYAARTIAAANRDLAALVAAGAFRADLYHRLNQATLRVPPLRERREDIAPLAAALLARASAELGRDVRRLEPDALARLVRHDWPGNVRELEHVLKRSLLTSRGASLALHDLVMDPPAEAPAATLALCRAIANREIGSGGPEGGAGAYARTLAMLEGALIERALEVAGGSQVAAARLLGISRTTLRAKLGATAED